TNETCNQHCGFCTARRPVERARIAAPEAVRARLDEAVRAGAREIVLTGGEPTLRRDLPALVAYARRSSGVRIILETNGALTDDARAQALRKAGLSLARVHVPRWGDACDAVTRDEGGFARTYAGLTSLARAGITLEIAAPVVSLTAAAVFDLPKA